MLTFEEKIQFSEILEELGKVLDITKSQYENAVNSYQAIGNLLSNKESLLAPYKPMILPQGSFLLGTMVKPDSNDNDLDIDLVCRLSGKNSNWTQYDLKGIVGNQISSRSIYKEKLNDGRRCWTIEYSDTANYHLDILPAIVANDYQIILEKSLTSITNKYDELAIRITDKKEDNFRTSQNMEDWPKSNPFGYGIWFFNRSNLGQSVIKSIQESIKPVPKYDKLKIPLQRVVQILKRHRDIMFSGDEHKPISIIITTLAAKAYNGEQNIIDALIEIVQKMPNLLEKRYSHKFGKLIYWISNPVNDEENFADKWPEHPQKEKIFFHWIDQLKQDIPEVLEKRGLNYIQESLEKSFGKDTILKAFTKYGENQRLLRESGNMKMAINSGMIVDSGDKIVKSHTFFGNE